MKRSNVVVSIVSAVICSSALMLGLAGCGGDSGPTPGGLAIVTTSLPEGQINQPYSASVGGSGGTLPYVWSVTPALPDGLSFNKQSGAITGTPSAVGTTPLTFTLADSSIPPQIVAQSLSLTIKPPLAITTTSLPDGNIGAVYDQPVQTVGGFGPLTFTIVPGTGTLPPGLSLDPNTGRISGTPTLIGNSSFTVRVADTSGQQDTKPLSIRINPQSPPSITTISLPAGTVLVPYGPTIVQAAAGIGALTWSIPVGSLPPGLTISTLTGPSVTISGTPTTAGLFNFTMRVTDTLGQFATQPLSITINKPAGPNITTDTLPSGSIGQTYNQAVLATGTGTLTFSIVSPGTGTLPPGLSLLPSGTIIGQPTAPGTFPFTVRVADSFGQSDTKALSIQIFPNTHHLTVLKSGNGTVSSSPSGISCGPTCDTDFPIGATVTLTAAPAAGSTFSGWSGGGCSGTGSCIVSMNSDQTVTATFATPVLFSLTVTKAGVGQGTVTSNPAGIDCGATCSFAFTSGTTVTLTATASAGSTFGGWSESGCTTATCVVVMTQNRSVTATFNAVPSTLTVSKDGTGTGSVTSNPTGIDCGATCSAPFPTGTSVTLTATASAGSSFAGWSGGGCTGTGPCTTSMTTNQTVTATFNLDPAPTATVTVNKIGTGAGTVTSNPSGINCGATCSAAFATGTLVTLTASPDADSDFIAWSGACSGPGNCTFTVTADTAVGAQFDLKPP